MALVSVSKRSRTLLADLALGVLFFLVPLSFAPRAAESFTLGKDVPALAALAFLFTSLSQGAWQRVLSSGLARLGAVFLAWMFLSSFFTASAPGEVFPGGVHWVIFFASLVLGLGVGPATRRKGWAFVAAAALPVAVLAFAQAGGFDAGISWTSRFENRVFSTFGNPNFLAGYLAALLPGAAAVWIGDSHPRRSFWAGVLFLLLAGSFTLTRVRGAYPAVGLGVVVALAALALCPAGREALARRRVPLIAAACVLCLSLLVLLARQGGWSTFSLSGDTAKYRLETWRVTGLMLNDHLALGVGLGNFKVHYPSYQWKTTSPGEPLGPYTLTEHTHNEPLQVASESGLIGLGLGVALFGLGLLGLLHRVRSSGTENAHRLEAAASLGGLTALAVFSLTNFPIQLAPCAALAGWMLSAGSVTDREIPEPLKTGPLPVLATGILLVVLGRTLAGSVAYRNTLGEMGLGNLDNAVRYGTRLVGLEPSRHRSYLAAAEAWRRMGVDSSGENSLSAYQKAAQLNPLNPEAHLGIAAYQVSLGRFAPALEAAEKGVSIAPNLAPLQFTLGTALFQTGRVAESEGSFRTAVALKPDDFDAWLNLGVALVAQGRKVEAAQSWSRAFALRPEDEKVRTYLKSVGVQLRKAERP